MKDQNQYWPIDCQTKEIQQAVLAEYRGGMYHIPKGALTVEPLPPKKGFAVVALDDLSGTEYIEDHRGTVIYDTADCTVSETVNELGPIKEGFTDKKPKTRWDKWIGGDWVTDLSAQYIDEFDAIDNIRRSLYVQVVDPLIAEAVVKRLKDNEAEALELEKQGLAAREKIQLDHPWPVNPEA
ncbi:hypothetical protein ACSL9B_001630 [Vibrio cholerae]|nr:hypothetical protein [Vibrio cholerae]ELJ8754077.1 hypothetical protein [Vibrio cholerae]